MYIIHGIDKWYMLRFCELILYVISNKLGHVGDLWLFCGGFYVENRNMLLDIVCTVYRRMTYVCMQCIYIYIYNIIVYT